MTNHFDDIAILGAGAMGLLWSSKLRQHNIAHTLITRTQAKAQQLNTIHYTDTSQQTVALQGQTASIDSFSSPKILLLTVKVHQLEQALLTAKKNLQTDCRIVLMQNGLGAENLLQKILPKNDYRMAVVSHAAFCKSEHEVVLGGIGECWLGSTVMPATHSADELDQWLCQTLNQTGLHCQWHEKIQQQLTRKFIISCLIPPLTAIENCKNGELLTDPVKQQKLKALFEEASMLFIKLDTGLNLQQLWQLVLDIAQSSSQNYSSMHQDILHHRITEVEFFTGHLLKLAKQHGLHLALHQAIYEQLTGCL